MSTLAAESPGAGLALGYDRQGAGEPLLLIHALGMSRRAWRHLIGPLAEHYDVIAVDSPGFGSSPPHPGHPEPTAAGTAAVLAEFVRSLGIESAHVAGVSAGGWAALELGKLPLALSVTALCPGGFWKGRAPRYVEYSMRSTRTLAQALRGVMPVLTKARPGRTLLLSQMMARPWRLTPEQAAALCEDFASCPGFDRALAAGIDDHFTGGEDVRVPVTIAQGTRDRLMLRWQSRHYAGAPAQAQLAELPGCGHVPLWDDPELVLSVIRQTTARAVATRTAGEGTG